MKQLGKIRTISAIVAFMIVFLVSFDGISAKKPKNARFYDFSDQLIDGQIKKPTTLYIDSRTRAKFQKLLNLKRSFRDTLILSAKDPILK